MARLLLPIGPNEWPAVFGPLARLLFLIFSSFLVRPEMPPSVPYHSP